jgi:hypothetical protein
MPKAWMGLIYRMIDLPGMFDLLGEQDFARDSQKRGQENEYAL